MHYLLEAEDNSQISVRARPNSLPAMPELPIQASASSCKENMAHYHSQGALPSYTNKFKLVDPGKPLQQTADRLTHT